MIDVTFSVNSMQLYLVNLLPFEKAAEINQLETCPGNHRRFLYPYTSQGTSRGFRELYTAEEQAFCQLLAHRGCIPSTLLFGYSLTTDYRDSRRVYCDINAYEYQFVGVEALLIHQQEYGFVQECNCFMGSPVLYRICAFLVQHWRPYGYQHGEHPVIKFCEETISRVHSTQRFNS